MLKHLRILYLSSWLSPMTLPPVMPYEEWPEQCLDNESHQSCPYYGKFYVNKAGDVYEAIETLK